jgi:hypothetical protein
MDNEERYYIGFLANVDSSILSVKLDHGFIIESMSIKQYQDFISDIKKDDLNYKQVWDILSYEYPIVNFDEQKIYFIKNTSKKYLLYPEYLPQILTMFRLFSEGNIRIPIQFKTAPIKENKLLSLFSSEWAPKSIRSAPKYTLKKQDTSKVNTFLKTVKIPFKKSYLQLALDHLERSYEMSYGPHQDNLSFLTLMIGFEALFTHGNVELSQTVSRHTSVLIGKNEIECKKIYSNMRDFYRRRSQIVHGAEEKKFKNISEEEITQLRNYLRACIKEIYEIGYDKEKLFDYLNSKGF